MLPSLIRIGILCVALLVSCSPEDSDDHEVVFHYNQHNNITSLDPAFAKSQNNIWAVNHIYSTLVQLDDSLNIQPALADSWSVSDDAMTYTFYLRDSVFFHTHPCFRQGGTRKVVSSDVEYSFKRLIDSRINAPGSWIFLDKVEGPESFQSMADSVFTLTLKQPFGPLLSLLSMQYCSIIPEEAVDYYGREFYRNPVGTGPFYFLRWVDNEGLFLKRNDDYYEWQQMGPTTNVELVRTSFIGERSIALMELINGRIDFFSGVESSYINNILEANGTKRKEFITVDFIKAPFLNFEYLGINPDAQGAHPLLKQRQFRQALNWAVDRKEMLKTLRNDIGVPANAGVIPKGLPAYDPAKVVGYDYDPDKALTLLSSFDPVMTGQELVLHTSKDYLDLTTYVSRQWENIGLNPRIEVMESATLRDAMRNGEVALFRASWIADYPDGESFLSMFYSRYPAPPNYTQFKNVNFDELYTKALAIADPDKKVTIYQEMDRILVEQAPVVFLFYDEVALFADAGIEGISKNALNLLQVKNLQVK